MSAPAPPSSVSSMAPPNSRSLPSPPWISSAPISARCSKSPRSEEHTSELQSLAYLVCRLLLEKKKKKSYKQPLNKTARKRTVHRCTLQCLIPTTDSTLL